jgi:DNA-binding response OmpR family regulator
MVMKSLEGKSILLVDDDYDMLDALQAILHDSGAVLRTAADGNAALDVAGQFHPDLVVLDAMLPKRSGFLVLEKLKGPTKKKGTKPYVIMITGNAGKRHQQWAESLGVDGYLNKPFRMEKLLSSMEQLLAANGGPSPAQTKKN